MSASTEFIVLLEKIEQVVGKNKGRIIVNLAISELEKIASREGVILLRT